MTRYATIPIVRVPSWDALDSPIIEGDCLEVMRQLPSCSVDGVLTDPPYGLSREPNIAEVLQHWLAGDDYEHRGGGFMGNSWDSFVPGPVYWREAFRVLKPGAHLVAFGGTRTVDLLSIALRLAGFEIRDTLCWLFGSGFPKSLDVSKAIDRAAGAERKVVGPSRSNGRAMQPGRSTFVGHPDQRYGDAPPVTAPATAAAAQWDGWGTALKPGHEPIVLARKPLVGTVAANVLEHGTGAVNIDACRIEHVTVNGGNLAENPHLRTSIKNTGSTFGADGELQQNPNGRWPANVVLDEEAAALLDEQTGELRSGFMAAGTQREGLGYRGGLGTQVRNDTHGDSGGASRFFYCAKTSRAERNAGLDGFPELPSLKLDPTSAMARDGRRGSGVAANVHPTVKPIALMAWLLRLVTPSGGVVLDPFAGSGSTVCAGATEGIAVVGLERESTYVGIARARAAWWAEHPRALVERPRQPRAAVPDPERVPTLLDSLGGEAA